MCGLLDIRIWAGYFVSRLTVSGVVYFPSVMSILFYRLVLILIARCVLNYALVGVNGSYSRAS